jgi:hypothetical protein
LCDVYRRRLLPLHWHHITVYIDITQAITFFDTTNNKDRKGQGGFLFYSCLNLLRTSTSSMQVAVDSVLVSIIICAPFNVLSLSLELSRTFPLSLQGEDVGSVHLVLPVSCC